MPNAPKPHVIGLDIGTTSTIGILIGLPETLVSVASRPTMLSSPHPGWAEEDPAGMVGEFLRGSPRTDGACADRSALAGICVTGMVPALVLLDSDGQAASPEHPAERRPRAEEVAELAAEVDEAGFLTRTGNGVNQQLIATKLALDRAA